MLRAEESSNFSMEGCSEPNCFGVDDFAEDLFIDLDLLLGDEGHDDGSEDLQSFPEEKLKRASPNGETPSIGNRAMGLRNDLVCLDTLPSSYSSEVSDTMIGVSGGSTINQGVMLSQRVQGSPMNSSSASLEGWISLVPGNGTCSAERDSLSLPTCSATSFSLRDDDDFLNFGDKFDSNTQQNEREIKLRNTEADFNPQDILNYSEPEDVAMDFFKHGIFGQDTIGTMGLSENNSCTAMQISVMDADMCSQDTMSKESALCPGTDVMMDYSAARYDIGADYPFVASYNFQPVSTNDEWANHVKNEDGEFPTESACSSTKMELNDDVGVSGKSSSGVSIRNYFDIEGWSNGYESNDYASSIGRSFFDANSFLVDEKASMNRVNFAPSSIYGEDKVKDEKPDESIVPSIPMWQSDMIDETVSRKNSYSADKRYFHEDSRSSFSGVSSSLSGHKIQNLMDKKEDPTVVSKKVCHSRDYNHGSSTPFNGNGSFEMNAHERHIPHVQPFSSINNHPMSDGSLVSKVSPESSHSNFSEKSVVEDDPDICIIEDISHPAPAPTSQSPALRNTLITPQRSNISANYMGVGGLKSKAKDERLLLRLLQDLSQPKLEMNPPEGLLAVSLLRHQKIALSWMVQKETDSSRCSGGILADDQGLGKTISTISLILKERPPSHKASPVKKEVTETLNLDEDDDVPPVSNDTKEQADTLQIVSNETPMRSKIPLVVGKGRPAAGTLIVCPTSVLRQWDEELRNKVTSKANLSVLVYHGSNRTKDPCELAKYDVVLTTYSIVSMEVPKQPRADEDDDDERGNMEDDGMPVGLSFDKKHLKRKHSNKKGSESVVPESFARPLAKVGWFRVVLDEAQSIKNHRTQVARACWGLRAKRRWCLSGTPIQNAIDDLYSYFRFLKYDPFDSYKLFRSNIKAPINKSPANGYRKLQTILKTIMLRRTKGTILDGEPIINLPPKYIELKKVDFSQEERDFYSRLEADSRAQFEEYAAAGTVKQNYVNILLMLLRLRQACDHPFLVKGANSSSLWTSSVEIAKNLPRDEKEHLLRCLEASLAICGICNDPPEDAVVAKCGHVFCNQCISEHLTGDEHQCPNANCKIRLNVSSVFSKATLNSFLHDQSHKDGSDSTGPEVVEPRDSCPEGLLYNSSKIKAALDVLQSLCRLPDCSSGNSSTQNISDGQASSVESSMATLAAEPLQDVPESQNLDSKQSSTSIKVVGQKAIVFSQWTRMLDLLESCLKSSSIKYRRLDGTMSVTARDKAVKDFNTLPEVTVMIMSLKAASLGLNMVAACHVLLLDLWWNPTTEDQAIDRAHRIGQTRPVTVLRLTVKDTVEDRILALQQKKREMVASAFGEDEMGGRQTRLTVEDLKYLFMI